jgi:hypothetical protein
MELNCFNDCTPKYNLLQPPTSVTLTATPTGLGAAASSFAGWSGSGCVGTGSCVVSMTAARLVTATFAVASSLSSNVPNIGNVSKIGDVTGDGTADLIWRENSSGAVAVWPMSNGTVGFASVVGGAPISWIIQ